MPVMVRRLIVAAAAALTLAACGSDPEPVPQKVIIVQPDATVPQADSLNCSETLIRSVVATYLAQSGSSNARAIIENAIAVLGETGAEEEFIKGMGRNGDVDDACAHKLWVEVLDQLDIEGAL